MSNLNSSSAASSAAPTNGDVHKATDLAKSNEEAVTTRQVFFTKDGTPVEPASIPAKEPFGPTPDANQRPDVVEKTIHLDENGNETSRTTKQ